MQYFNLIWDEAEEIQRLANLSHPKVTIDTADLSAEATELANLLAKNFINLDDEQIRTVRKIVTAGPKEDPPNTS